LKDEVPVHGLPDNFAGPEIKLDDGDAPSEILN
jgi:hypothetical protein